MPNTAMMRKKNRDAKRRGIGIDMQLISDFPRYTAMSRDRFYHSVFTEKEIAYCTAKADPRQHFAARRAGKNAARKAIGDQFFDLKEIEITNEEDGHPIVKIGSTGKKVIISLSHTDTHAIAIALWQ